MKHFVDNLPEKKPTTDEILDALEPLPGTELIVDIMTDFVRWFEDYDLFTLDGFAAWFDTIPEEDKRDVLEAAAEVWQKPSHSWPEEFLGGFRYLLRQIPQSDFYSLSDEGIPIIDLLGYKGKKEEFITAHLPTGLRAYYRRLAEFKVTWKIPDDLRKEHHFILGATGHGKSYTIQSMVMEDMKSDHAVIVIDSQRQLIRNLLDVVPEDRLILIDPTIPDHKLGINLFESGNSELYEYIFAALDSELTPKQATLYRYISRLLEVVPNANIHTMRKMLEFRGLEPYLKYADGLSETVQAFLRDAAHPKGQYNQTREEVLRRLYTLLENDTFADMFSSTEAKIDMGKAMREGKIVLIDTAKGALGQGFSMFGRFWIAQIAKAMFQERAGKAYVYLDEAHEYFSDETMLNELFAQARKHQVGMVAATQLLQPIPTSVQASLLGNTAIRYAATNNHSDAVKMAQNMNADPDEIKAQSRGNFVAWYKGHEPATFRAKMPSFTKRTPQELQRIKNIQKSLYYIPKHAPPKLNIVQGEPVDEWANFEEETRE